MEKFCDVLFRGLFSEEQIYYLAVKNLMILLFFKFLLQMSLFDEGRADLGKGSEGSV